MSAVPDPLPHLRGWATRARVRTRAVREDLDRRLAEGADPAGDPMLKSRADCLVAPASRARLAAALERVVASVDGSDAPAAVAVPRRPVHGARHELMRLAGELRHMPEPRPRGVAMAQRLLSQPSSPLYTAATSDEVARAARAAADSMRA